MSDESESLMGRPGPDGRFGEFGGRFVPESLMPACLELEKWFDDAWADPAFRAELDGLLRDYGGRPTPVTECTRLSERLGVRVLLKREDLAHTGSHKLNNVVGQALLTKRMGKARMIAETGAGQHGVASATAAALFGLECTVFMGEVDTKRQELNVFRMELLGAEVRTVTSGSRTLKDAVNEAMREWVATVDTTHYCLGSVMGPHPVPLHGAPVPARRRRGSAGAVRRPARRRRTRRRGGLHRRRLERGGDLRRFRRHPARLVGVEAAGGAAVTNGIPGVLHGMYSRLLQDEAGQIEEAESISAGLDYPGLGPEHAHLAAIGRAEYSMATDDEVLEAFRLLSHTEGIIPALESAHAVAWVAKSAGTDALPAGSTVLITLSGRGDKDVAQVREIFGRRAMPDLEKELRAGREQGRKLLIPYLMGGMTDDWTQSLAAVVAAGADAVEVGIPFSDPMMDGPVIQEAALRALQRGTVPDQVLDGIARAEAPVPIAVMTYYNLVFRAGHKRMARSLAAAGVSGAILADLPIEEIDPWAAEADAAGIDTVLLVAPSSPPERVERICARARGFVYAVARMGVTGERVDLGSDVAKVVERIRRCTDMPVCVGVGVSTPDQAAEVCEVADGVVVGSALVRRLLEEQGPEGAAAFVGSFRDAID